MLMLQGYNNNIHQDWECIRYFRGGGYGNLVLIQGFYVKFCRNTKWYLNKLASGFTRENSVLPQKLSYYSLSGAQAKRGNSLKSQNMVQRNRCERENPISHLVVFKFVLYDVRSPAVILRRMQRQSIAASIFFSFFYFLFFNESCKLPNDQF